MKTKELTPEFRKEFVIKIGGAKGKEAVLYNGLLALAHADERFGHIRAYITQYPSSDNRFVCFARAEIYGTDGNMLGMEEADASKENCGKMTAASFPRMALTRAKGRAMRDFLNVAMVTADEIPDVYEPELATPRQIGELKKLGKQNKMKKNEFEDLIYDETGADGLNDLTEKEALHVKKVLEDMLQNDQETEEDMDFSDEE